MASTNKNRVIALALILLAALTGAGVLWKQLYLQQPVAEQNAALRALSQGKQENQGKQAEAAEAGGAESEARTAKEKASAAFDLDGDSAEAEQALEQAASYNNLEDGLNSLAERKKRAASLVNEGREALKRSKQAAAQNSKLGLKEKLAAKEKALQEARTAKEKASAALELDGDSAEAKQLLEQAASALRSYENLEDGLNSLAERKKRAASLVNEGREALKRSKQAAAQNSKLGLKERRAAKEKALQEARTAKEKASAALELDGDSAEAKQLLEQAASALRSYENLEDGLNSLAERKKRAASLVNEGREALKRSKQAVAQNSGLGLKEKRAAKEKALQEARTAKEKASAALELDGDSAEAKQLLEQAASAQRSYENLKLEEAAASKTSKRQAAERQAAESGQREEQKKAEELQQLRKQLQEARAAKQKDKIDRLLQEILKRDPGDSLANTAKARRIEEKGGNLKDAEKAYRKALAREPSQAEALAGLAENLEKQGRLNEALQAYNNALKNPFNSELMYQRGVLLYRMGRYRESVAGFQNYLKKGGGNLRAYYGLGLADERLKRSTSAIRAYQTAIAKGLQHAPTYWSLSKLELQRGKLQKALENVAAALKLEAKDSRYLQTKGQILFKLQRYKEAAAVYAQADAAGLESKISSEERGSVRYNLGLSYYNSAQYPQAEAALRKAMATDGSKPEYLLSLVDVQVAAGEVQAAEQTLAAGEKKFPDNAELFLAKGNLFLNQKKYQQALASLQKAYKRSPKNRIIINNLGLSYMNLKRFDESRDFFRKAIQGDRGNSALWFNLALVDMASEQHSAAITSLKQVIQLDAKKAEAYYFLTKEYILENRRDEAKKTLEKLRSITPTYAKISELEDLLK